ncbi:MAG TPA: SpoIID/LytB domain-containing protein [Thermoanaerobaculia bacterium]|nr:SpoIID/LytB domain-containing protein [Thermoanaerobaculia bacterium]
MIAHSLLLVAALLSFRDSATGFAVAAEVERTPAELLVQADGYEASRFAAADLPTTVWLDPAEPPEELRPDSVAARLRAGFLLLHGHVSDRQSGAPLPDAVVTARGAGVSARSNDRGYFAMYVAAAPEAIYPEGEDLSIEIDGYATHLIRNTALLSGADTHFVVRLERGEGVTSRDDSHKIWLHRPGGEHPHAEEPAGEETAPAKVIVPASIRVGFNCACAACSTVEVFSLETYVKRGLNDEWIASWPQESLRAGAVAYRSYGAWHTVFPRNPPNYDICSTTCCQVNDPDTSLSTNAAVDATRGVLLVRDGLPFRSEYSAELNNLLGMRSCSNHYPTCGDGFAGSPNTSWPCLHDPVCQGHSCFGHGRGMCQWGTERWARQGMDWRWITNHYYNDSGRPAGLRSAFIADPPPPPPRRRAVGR